MISKELVSFKFCFIIGFILLIHHATHNSILCYYCKQPTFDLVSFDLSYFLRQKAKKFQKVPFIFFRSPSLPCLFTLRPLASIWIFHILALITIFFSCDAFKCRHNYVPKSKTFQLSTLKIKISMQGLSLDFLNFSLFTSNKLFKIDCLLMRKSKKKQFSVPKKEY